MKLSRRSALCLAASVALFLTGPAMAKPNAETLRLMKKRDSERYEVKTSHSSVKAGAARVTVKAPTKVVKKVVQDFGRYDDFMPRFKKANIVGRKGKQTDVYIEVPILRGAAKVWAVVRFSPPKRINSSEEVVEGHMIKGNVRRLDAKWKIKKIDADNTQLHLEMLIVPKLPVPGSLVTGEVAYAADKGVMGARDRAEKKHAKSK